MSNLPFMSYDTGILANNFVCIKTFSLFYKYYAYIDTKDLPGDDLFIKKEIPVQFRGDFHNNSKPYTVVFCRVKKKYAEKFLEALDELHVLHASRPDGDKYELYCEDFMNYVEEQIKRKEL